MMNVAPAMKMQAMHDKSVNEEQFLRTACQCISKVVLLRVWKKSMTVLYAGDSLL